MAKRNERLEAARLKNRWTLEVASEKIGVSLNTYHRWELGVQNPRLSSLDMLCKAFEMTPEELGYGHLTSLPETRMAECPASFGNVTSRIVSTPEFSLKEPVVTTSLPLHFEIPPLDQSLFKSSVFNLLVVQQQRQWSFDTLLSQIEQSLRSYNEMTMQQNSQDDTFSRRQALVMVASMPISLLGLTGKKPELLSPDELLPLCSSGIAACWRLCNAKGLAEVEHMLPGYLAHLTPLAREESRYQIEAANLTSQAYGLAYLVALHKEEFGTALTHSREALFYGRLAQNDNLKCVALIRQANTFFYRKRPLQTMQAYQQALQYANTISPLLLGRVYMGLAEVHSRMGQKNEATNYLGRAKDSFPDYPEQDTSYSYAHISHSSVLLFEGMTYANMRDYRRSLDTFEHINVIHSRSTVPERVRVEFQNHEAATAVAAGDMDLSCSLLTSAANASLAIKSDLRYSESCNVYQKLQTRWAKEPKVQALSSLFQR